jgi:hypothetical protein
MDKNRLRQVHRPAQQLEVTAHQNWLRHHLPNYLPFFANGHEVTPERIDPSLVEVTKKSGVQAPPYASGTAAPRRAAFCYRCT